MMSRALLRRLFAALILVGFAVGSVLFWNNGRFDALQFGFNSIVAVVGFIWLHIRWRAKERAAMTPSKVKDIFS